MILHPGVLALVTGSAIVILMMLYSSLLGLKILAKWDMDSSSPGQLSLERRTYLVSTIMNYVFGFLVLSGFLFIYTADDIHSLFVGAMCATGSLNANPVGWKVLYAKIIVLFISLVWMAVNYVDQRAEDYPLVKIKYAMLLFITPLIILDAYFLVDYFSGLKPSIITSCCGSLFSEEGEGMASGLSSLPIRPMMILFYSTVGIFLLTSLLTTRFNKSIFIYASALLCLALFPVSIASVVSFISLYFYELPTHHCPFDILQKDYSFVGYPLYATLFSGIFFGIAAGVVEPFKKIPSLKDEIQKSQKKWTALSIILISIFTVICSWPIIFSEFTLEGYL